MRIVTKITVLLAVVASLGLVGCSSTTSGNKIIAKKSEFDLKDSVIVGKTTKREVYEMYGEPTKNFGKVGVNLAQKTDDSKASALVSTMRGLRDGNLNEPDDESYKISNPKTTNLIVYSYTVRKTNSAKRYIPVAGNFMSSESNLELKAFYIGFDDNDIVTERWYSHTKRSGSSKSF